MPEFLIRREFLISDLGDQLRLQISNAFAAERFRNGALLDDQRAKLPIESGKPLAIKASAYLANIAQPILPKNAEQESAEMFAAPSRVVNPAMTNSASR